jgi:hypothetical protein
LDNYKQASTGGERGGGVEETAVEVESVGGGKIIYYQARGAGRREMNNMTNSNKIVII